MSLYVMKDDCQKERSLVFLYWHPFFGEHDPFAAIDIHHVVVVVDQLPGLFKATDGNSLIGVDSIEIRGSGHRISQYRHILPQVRLINYLPL